MYTNTVQKSTQRTYSTAEKRWFQVAHDIGTDPCMRIIPVEWEMRLDRFRDTTISWKEACMVTLLASFTEEGQAISPRTVGVYMSGVRKYLQNNGVDTQFMDTSQYIRNTKAGLAQLFRVQLNRTTADSERLPITIDMIRAYCADGNSIDMPMPQRAVYTAAILGFTIVARVSEYLDTGTSEHMLHTEDIVFKTTTGAIIPAHMAVNRQGATPETVSVLIRSKKNDQRGRGYKYHFTAAADNDTYCIVHILWTYAVTVQPQKGASLFYIPGLQWTLKPPYFAAQLKAIGRKYGLDETRISSHSLRIGGATTLAAAGLSDSDVRNMGEWKSNAFMQYIRRNTEMFDRARRVMASTSAMTAQDVKNAYAATNRESVMAPEAKRNKGGGKTVRIVG